MSQEDTLYYRERISAERHRAAVAPTPEIAAIHEKLAGMYEDLIGRLERSQAAQDLEPLPHAVERSQSDSLQ